MVETAALKVRLGVLIDELRAREKTNARSISSPDSTLLETLISQQAADNVDKGGTVPTVPQVDMPFSHWVKEQFAALGRWLYKV